MKYILSFFALTFFCGCGYFGNNEVMIGPIINEIIDTDSGTLFIISNDSNRDLDLVGVEYRIPGERFFRLQNQFVANSVSDSILVPDLNDGVYEFRVFAASDDYYGYSDIIEYSVASPVPDLPCEPTPNTVRSNFGINTCTSNVRVEAEAGSFGTYDIVIECSTGFPIRFSFPREPSSGIYTTFSGNIENVDFAARRVGFSFQTGFGGIRTIESGGTLYVTRTATTTTLTMCDMVANTSTFNSGRITGRYVLVR